MDVSPHPQFVDASPHSRSNMGQLGGGSGSTEAHEEVDPTLLIDTGRYDLQSLRWAPANPNLVAVSGTTDALVELFDLQYTQVWVVNKGVLPCPPLDSFSMPHEASLLLSIVPPPTGDRAAGEICWQERSERHAPAALYAGSALHAEHPSAVEDGL